MNNKVITNSTHNKVFKTIKSILNILISVKETNKATNIYKHTYYMWDNVCDPHTNMSICIYIYIYIYAYICIYRYTAVLDLILIYQFRYKKV